MIKNFSILFLSALMLMGCSQKQSFKLTGSFNGEEHKYIYIDRVDVNKSERIDSARINKQGKFNIKIKSNEPDYYQLGFSSTGFINLLASPGEKINLVFKGANLYDDYQVSGSPGSRKVKMLDSTLVVTKKKLASLRVEYEKAAKAPDFENKEPILDKAFSDLIVSQRKYNIAFILENTNSLASIKALYQKINEDAYVLYDPRDLQFLKIVNDSLKVHYPNSRHVIALNEYFQNELNKFYLDQITQEAMSMPAIKLDPTLTDNNGKKIVLSSLKGKYVLLSFWSVFSQDCVAENLQFKELYSQYNKKGFEIYQINIDVDETAWKNAVKYDELPWISVREDSTSTITNSVLFNVQTLPANFLYDKNGEIIAKDIHGAALKLKLEQLLGK